MIYVRIRVGYLSHIGRSDRLGIAESGVQMVTVPAHPGANSLALAGMTSTAVTMFAIAGMTFERSADNHALTAQGYRDSEARNVEAIGRIGAGSTR
jgi:hypothetical protein